MGVFKDIIDRLTKEDDLERKNAKYLEDYEEYQKKVRKITEETTRPFSVYNNFINVINGERYSLRDEIHELYCFLGNFKDMGIALTPFDYVIELPLVMGAQLFADDMGRDKQPSQDNAKAILAGAVGAGAGAAAGAAAGAVGAGAGAAAGAAAGAVGAGAGAAAGAAFGAGAGAAALPILPILLPALAVGGATAALLQKRNANKKEIEKLTNDMGKDELKWEYDIAIRENQRDFYVAVAEIAELYNGCIATVKDVIKRQIILELEGVLCFLFADVIKDCIKEGKKLTKIPPNDITYYQDPASPYYKHYLFVKNTLDFYTLICAIFTKPYLTKLINDQAIAEDFARASTGDYDFEEDVEEIRSKTLVPEDDKKAFKNDFEEINKQMVSVQENIVFTEVNENV